ncbi:uncharacterized protein LOC132902198 [Amyelois transitella]|uniref:uncharacterized protein LOC132902198 n=1 Tax=Amyelois transitella TaxID=680683 RepID=UPI00299057D5|nr:uncharacterized protein LOC132902198 [Amyelois transitella]
MATALVDNWTEGNCITLIREFRARPALWDKKDPFYYKRLMKLQLWDEIGEKLDMNALECKHKMEVLLSSFRREKAKIIHKLEDYKGDTSEICLSTWFAFKEMMFLLDKDAERKRQETGSDNIEDEAENMLRRTLLRHYVQPISKRKRPRLAGLLKEMVKQPMEATTSKVTDTSPRPSPPVTACSSECDDEIKSFANFISFKMKKYSETTKNAVQQAICDIIFKADQNFYESNNKYIILDEKDPPNKQEEKNDIMTNIKDEFDIVGYSEEESD